MSAHDSSSEEQDSGPRQRKTKHNRQGASCSFHRKNREGYITVVMPIPSNGL
ncbi:hypothetical protein COCON_G00039220 [Conger conger]|uniref:Uncharacterized protein n=1 Tax=Conger conger TaxID=82655 RepID=A0A9Q1I651_CONCO|nr:hypothetical protein COCON_G00039220 [Conger conger]